MVGCSAYGCTSRSERKEFQITFHRFPVKYPKRLALWLRNMHIANWEPTKNDRLCSKHFQQDSFYRIGNKTCLLDDAIPTVFNELPKYLQKKLKPKRTTKRSQQAVDQPSTSATPNSEAFTDQNLEEDTPTEKRIRRQLFLAVTRCSVKSKQLKQLQQKVRRYKQKITSLKRILKGLIEKTLPIEHSSLLNNLPEICEVLIKQEPESDQEY